MGKGFCFTVALLLVAGCGANNNATKDALAIYDVQVPVAQARAVPPELMEPVLAAGDLPAFVAPSDPKASSALTVAGERQLRAAMAKLLTRIRSWEAWAND